MSIIFDLVLVAIILFCAFRGFIKGFVRTFMKLVSFAGAAVLTFLLYNPVSQFLYDTFVYRGVSGYIQNSFNRDVASTEKSLDHLFTELPEFFTKFLERFTSQAEATQKYAEGGLDSSDKLVSWLSSPIANTVSKVVAFVGLFIIIYIVLRVVTTLLDRIMKLPILNGLNKALGFILGIILGVLTAWIFAIAFNSLIPIFASLFPKVFRGATIDQTIITSALYNFNIFKIFNIINF